MCAYKRGERYFTSYHWCNECPPIATYRVMERQQKLVWANANKKRKEAWEKNNPKAVERLKKRKQFG